MTEFIKEYIRNLRDMVGKSLDSNEVYVSEIALDEIQRQQERVAECHILIDNVLDNRNVGMQTGNSSLEFRLAELVSYYSGIQERVKELEAEREQTCEWKQETSIYDNEKFYTSPYNQYDNVCCDYQMRKNVYCRTCGKRIKYVEEYR